MCLAKSSAGVVDRDGRALVDVNERQVIFRASLVMHDACRLVMQIGDTQEKDSQPEASRHDILWASYLKSF